MNRRGFLAGLLSLPLLRHLPVPKSWRPVPVPLTWLERIALQDVLRLQSAFAKSLAKKSPYLDLINGGPFNPKNEDI